MLRNTKWKLEKTKVKVVFRLQFHATNIPQSGWDKLFICFIPTESGKIIAKTSKANVRNGTCKWADPIYETTRLLVDSRNKRYDDKLYNLIVGMGSSHASILGEATINLADYADALNPYAISLPLHGSDQGTILHVTVQLLTAKTGFREFEQQFDKGLQSSSNYGREVEPSITTAPSSSELHISRELVPIMEETDMHEEFSDATPVVEYNGQCNNSESYNAAKNDSSGIPESRALNGPVRSQTRSTENADYSKDNKLAIALEENHRLRGSLETAESFIFELKQEVNTLHHQANEMNMETQKIAQHLTNEISSGLKLEREVMILKSECSKFKDELKQLNEIKLRSQFMEKTQDQRVNGLFLVEGRIRELQKKILIGFHESDLSFINSDLEMLLGIVQNLEKGTGLTRVVDLGESQSLELLCQLNEAKAERGNLIKKMNEMECYYESLVQELEENRDRLLVEFQKLRYEHLSCINTISTCKSETETIRLCMKDQILKFDKERLALSCVNEELEKRVMVVEAYVQELEENRERIVKEFESLKNEHSTCDDTISSCKYDTESIHHVNKELEKRVLELEENQEKILEDFEILKTEHSTCGDTLTACKTETESIRVDMNSQILKLIEEKHALDSINKELEKRVTTLESALERGRVNYAIAVTQLQKNLDMLAAQVSSLFETNQNLIKQTLSSENCASIAHDRREKPLSGGDDLSDEQIYEICCERLYFDVYSVILEERLLEVSRDARKIKTDHEKNVPEHQSESLRIAFMKEQCETTVQELKQQLFVSKRHGDDILIKLQDALDEIESRKKCEASYLKRIDELSFKIGGLEGELQSIQAELDCALLNLECCREEKEKIIAQITEFEKMKNERSILAMMSCGSSFQDLQRELMQLHKANEELECMYPRFKNFTGDGNTLGRVLALEIELAGALMVKKKSTIQFQSSFLKQHSDEEAIFRSFRDINELIKDTLEIKSKYVNVETELNEMHERYTQLSLQLAEVEGERQKLMMSVKYAR
ncbi:putative NT-type C2 domain-containing protein [Helianthus annuus]|nr:putative NT-type C2 domain-containing protein [Helianthus annuus]